MHICHPPFSCSLLVSYRAKPHKPKPPAALCTLCASELPDARSRSEGALICLCGHHSSSTGINPATARQDDMENSSSSSSSTTTSMINPLHPVGCGVRSVAVLFLSVSSSSNHLLPGRVGRRTRFQCTRTAGRIAPREGNRFPRGISSAVQSRGTIEANSSGEQCTIKIVYPLPTRMVSRQCAGRLETGDCI